MQSIPEDDVIIHWTGRSKAEEEAFAALQAICDDRVLLLKFCPTHVQTDFAPRISMACFTDVPLCECRHHCEVFGKFGLAFRKQRMITYGANPVFYTTAPHLERIKHVNRLLEKMRDYEKDREWNFSLEPTLFTEDETVALLEVMGFLQEYSYKNNDASGRTTYRQREWRLTYDIIPREADVTKHTPGKYRIRMNARSIRFEFMFEEADVAFVVVPRAFEARARNLRIVSQCELKIFEDAVP